MKRDMDLIRRIVLAVREGDGKPVNGLEDVSSEVFACHAQLLEEAGLVAAVIHAHGKRLPDQAVIFRLTWEGHEFADSIKDESVWRKAKDVVLKPSASWTFKILLKYLQDQIQAHLPSL